MTHAGTATGRRDVLRLVIAALCAVVVAWNPADAQTTDDAGPTAPIQRLDAALLAAMKARQRTPFAERFAAQAPMIEQTFDLVAVLSASVGLGVVDTAVRPEARIGGSCCSALRTPRYPRVHATPAMGGLR
jgi:hypothetical protein